MKSLAQTKLYRQILAIAGLIIVLVMSYYANMPLNAETILGYMKSKPLTNR